MMRQRANSKAAPGAFSMPMLEHPVAVRLKVPKTELPPTVPLPVPDAAHAGTVGTLPAAAEKLRLARLALIVAVRVPGISVPTAGFTSCAGPDAVLPDCVAVHVSRTAVPLIEVPIWPLHAPDRSAGGSEGDGPESPQAAQTTSMTRNKVRGSMSASVPRRATPRPQLDLFCRKAPTAQSIPVAPP